MTEHGGAGVPDSPFTLSVCNSTTQNLLIITPPDGLPLPEGLQAIRVLVNTSTVVPECCSKFLEMLFTLTPFLSTKKVQGQWFFDSRTRPQQNVLHLTLSTRCVHFVTVSRGLHSFDAPCTESAREMRNLSTWCTDLTNFNDFTLFNGIFHGTSAIFFRQGNIKRRG